MIGEDNQAIERNINIYCDNKSLIHRINNRCNFRMTTNQHRDAEANLELQVLQLKKQHNTVKMNYIRSHKQVTKDQFVSEMEHIHNYADNLCTQARLLPDLKEYHSLPANKVNLILNERVITAHAPKVTRFRPFSAIFRCF
jgi:hypothetical protein